MHCIKAGTAGKHVGGESAMCWGKRAGNATGNDTKFRGAQHLKEDKAAMRINRALMPDALHPEAVGMDALARCLAPVLAPHLPATP